MEDAIVDSCKLGGEFAGYFFLTDKDNATWTMEPIGLEISPKKGYVIRFRCTKCGGEGRNKAAKDDDFDLLLRLSAREP